MRLAIGIMKPGPHGTFEMSGVMKPWLTSSRSSPATFKRRTSSIDSSTVTPPSIQSVTESRAVSGNRSGHTFRTAGERLQQKPNPILETAAVVVGSLIGQRREELVREIAVREVEFQPLKPGRERPLRRRDKVRCVLRDILQRHLAGTLGRFPPNAIADGAMVSQPPASSRCGRRLPTAYWRSPCGRRARAECRESPLLLQELRDSSERLDVVIQVDAAVGRADPTFRR